MVKNSEDEIEPVLYGALLLAALFKKLLVSGSSI